MDYANVMIASSSCQQGNPAGMATLGSGKGFGKGAAPAPQSKGSVAQSLARCSSGTVPALEKPHTPLKLPVP